MECVLRPEGLYATSRVSGLQVHAASVQIKHLEQRTLSAAFGKANVFIEGVIFLSQGNTGKEDVEIDIGKDTSRDC